MRSEKLRYTAFLYGGDYSETVTVRCEGTQSMFVWRDGTLIRPRTSEYRISRATESDSGGYICCTMSLSVCSDIITLTVSFCLVCRSVCFCLISCVITLIHQDSTHHFFSNTNLTF
uniref:Ig-like domain-containing protein n=1 Tax=Maylandia zebra TaxID=106582 RepID=A0A3P9CZM3_9CICH